MTKPFKPVVHQSQADFMTLNTQPTLCLRIPIEVKVGNLYTRKILDLFQTELSNGLSLYRKQVLREGSMTVYKVGTWVEGEDKWEEVSCD